MDKCCKDFMIGMVSGRRSGLKKRLKKQLRQWLEMERAEIASLPAIRRHSLHALHFLHRVEQRFVGDQCIQRASALAYASLLATVPLLALGFSIFTSFQAFHVLAKKVRGVLLHYLLPASQDIILQYLGLMASKATALSIFGIIGLLITATALLNTMEEAFNHIWRISRRRPWLSKFTVFWATLTLAPVLIGVSITITSYFSALPFLRDVTAQATNLQKLPFLIPWLMSSLAMSILYMVLPNTRVPLRLALLGGMIAGVLFELTKDGFAFYVTRLSHYEKLYGALGALPIFLIWLYLVWVIVLAGAEITFCLQHPETSGKKEIGLKQTGIRHFFAHLILVRAAQALRRGRLLHMDDLLRETELPDNILQEWLEQLCQKGLLRAVEEDGVEAWTLGMDAGELKLADLHAALIRREMCVPEAWRDTPLGRALAGLYLRLERERKEVLGGVSILDLARAEAENQE